VGAIIDFFEKGIVQGGGEIIKGAKAEKLLFEQDHQLGQ
jgi:hypothetical protein